MLMEAIIIVLLNLWAPPLVAIGTCETQGLHKTTMLLCGLLGGSVSVRHMKTFKMHNLKCPLFL